MTDTTDYGQLTTADGTIVRDATKAEWIASAVECSNDEGYIEVDGQTVYVQGGPDA